MIGATLIFVILLFTVVTDQVQTLWPHTVFRGAVCSLCAAFLLIGIRRARLYWSWWTLALVLPTAWGLTQLELNATVWRFATWYATLQWSAYLALFVAALQVPALRSQLRAIAWFGGAFAVYAIAQYLLWHGPGEPMLAAFPNQNHYAAFMELLFPVVIWRLLRDRSKPVLVLCALAILASVAVSGSRAGVVLLLAELLYLGLRSSGKPLYVAAGALLVATVTVGLMWSRFQSLSTSEPYESRNATARASIQMARDRPLFGYGLGTWANIYPAYAERDTGFRLIHADDDWLEWAAEGGIPFVAIMLLVAAWALYSAWREPWCVGCVAVLLHSLVEFPMQKQALWAWLVVLLAAAQTSRKPSIARRKHSS